MKKKYIVMIIAAGIIALLGWLIFELAEPIMVMNGLSTLAEKKKRQLLYETDHAALAYELRKFANEVRWNRLELAQEPQVFGDEDNRLPASIRAFAPKAVIVSDDRIAFDQGYLDVYFGIVVFPDGKVGEGLKELAPGVWFYSNNNRLPTKE